MKINKKYSILLFAVLMSLGMTFSMSLALTLINVGLTKFWEAWPPSFVIGFVVSLPTSMIIIPIVRRIMDKLVAD
jgi:hypothetical protein